MIGGFNIRYIHYVLLGDKTKIYQIKSNNHKIVVNIFTKEDLDNFTGWCGTRFHEVYCDAELNTKHYDIFLKKILKPELCLKDSYKEIQFI